MSRKTTSVCFVRLKVRVMELVIVGGWETVECRLGKENFSAGRM
jgi:hypothetical protein